MPRPVRPWFRFYTEAFSDRKLRRLKPEYRWLFAACLGAARQSPQPGSLLVAEGVPMDVHDLADWAGMDVRTVKAGMRALTDLGLIVGRSSGDHQEIVWSSPTFLGRQYESDNVTKRTRKHRATRDNADVGTFQPSSEERSGNGGRNVPETETETETELTTPLGPPPQPDLTSPPAKPVPRKRGTRLPEGWRPDPAVVAAIRAEVPGVTSEQLEAQHRRFADHWAATPGAKGVKQDWPATWRNWMREAAARGQIGGAAHTRTNGHSNGTGSFDFDRAMARALATDQQELIP